MRKTIILASIVFLILISLVSAVQTKFLGETFYPWETQIDSPSSYEGYVPVSVYSEGQEQIYQWDQIIESQPKEQNSFQRFLAAFSIASEDPQLCRDALTGSINHCGIVFQSVSNHVNSNATYTLTVKVTNTNNAIANLVYDWYVCRCDEQTGNPAGICWEYYPYLNNTGGGHINNCLKLGTFNETLAPGEMKLINSSVTQYQGELCGTFQNDVELQSVNGDSSCKGFSAAGIASLCKDCIPEFCGDGILNAGEQCDDGNNVNGDGCSNSCKNENFNITLHKIVCDSESDLPNWGASPVDITSVTAQNFINSHQNCYFQENWSFQWMYNPSNDPGDNTGFSPFWNNITPTDPSGKTILAFNANNITTNHLWFREVFQSGYVPFTGINTNQDVSAEFYCNIDVLYYDNREQLSGSGGQSYYCIAFNAKNETQPLCGDSIVQVPETCDDGNNINGDGCSSSCKLENVNITLHKIVCDSESDLPNWASTNITINNQTAQDFINSHQNCYFQENWSFQWWIGKGENNPGDNTGFSPLWHNITPTDSSGKTSVIYPINDVLSRLVWFREVFQSGYIQFTGINTNQNVSAEFYCHDDVQFYDNREGITFTQEGNYAGDYYCIAFNAKNETQPLCGDSIVQNGEQCDDGNLNNSDGCNNQCILEFCGDGIKQDNEFCDDGNNVNGDGCSAQCNLEICGDGIIQSPETCDDGNQNNTDSCRNDCTIPICGDGIKDVNESCDDGNLNNTDSCNNQCNLPFCGDYILQSGEQCEPPNTNSCNAQCLFTFCGDSIVQSPEQCDDGNNNNLDSCNNQCLFTICGDGIIQVGEECDDGNLNNTDSCTNECTILKCIDEDEDGVCDEEDMCLDSKEGEEVDQMGCDNFQFCEKAGLVCGPSCFNADWKNNEPNTEFPKDCTVVVLLKNGIESQALCVPTEQTEMCAN